MAILSAVQVASYAYGAGFRGTNLTEAVAIAYYESTFNTNARNGIMYGLWQIDEVHLPSGTDPAVLYNPATNAYYAHKTSGGSNFHPWTTYDSGKYRRYMSQAQAAVNRMLSQSPAAVARSVTTYPAERVLVNGQKVGAINVNGVTYVNWGILGTLHIPYDNLGGGVFRITDVRTNTSANVQGVVYQNVTYLPWSKVPGLSNPVKIPGGFAFQGHTVIIGAVAAATLYAIWPKV